MKTEYEIEIYGSSDDLIEIEGQFSEELNHYFREDDPVFLAISDGTLLKVEYDGCWRISPQSCGLAKYEKLNEAVADNSDNYSDRVRLTSEQKFRFVALVSAESDIAKP